MTSVAHDSQGYTEKQTNKPQTLIVDSQPVHDHFVHEAMCLTMKKIMGCLLLQLSVYRFIKEK